MPRIAQKIGVAGALIGALFASDMAKPTEAEAWGRRGYGGSSFSISACIGGCFPGFYAPSIPIRYVQPAVVSVPYYVPTYPATGAYVVGSPTYVAGQPGTASASATATTSTSQADLDRMERIRKESREEGKEVGRLQATVEYQGKQIEELRQLARTPAQAPAPPPVQTPTPAPAQPSAPPAYTLPRENRAGEIQGQDWAYAEAAGNLLIRVLGPGTMHGQRFATRDMKETTCFYDAIRREPQTGKGPAKWKYWALVVGKETKECESKRKIVLDKNPALDVAVFEFNPADINVGDYQTARKATEAWVDNKKIPRVSEEKAHLLAR
ncbi:MAG: hypothetical protein HYU56_02895 [Candidatus Aenigmarchaeota archaeon]|nr:hypothetical protein [Candidatus Aenigmarchaeota archaeon]